MNSATSGYITYVATSPEQIWAALVDNELRRQWWRGHYVESSWRPGEPLVGYFPDGSVELRGTVLEADPGQTLVYECNAVWNDEHAEDVNRLRFEIEGHPSMAKLTFGYEASRAMVEMAEPGWPAVFSSLKSLLENGRPLPLDQVFGDERGPAEDRTHGKKL